MRTVVSLLLAVSAALNVGLARRLYTVERQVNALTAPSRPQIGQTLPSLELVDPSNRPVRVSFQEAPVPTVLYFLSPTCRWCDVNVPAIEALYKAQANRYRVVGIIAGEVAPEDLTSYLDKTKPSFPIYVGLRDADARTYRVSSTPTTMVVSRDGRLDRFWEGAFGGEAKADIERYFSMELPVLNLSPAGETR